MKPTFARKWIALGAVVCAFPLSLGAQGSFDNLDADNGMPTAQLGAPLKDFQGLNKTEDLGRFQTFTRPTDKMEFAGVAVSGITYNFFKEQLYSIDLDLKGTGNVKRMLKVLSQKYGKDPLLQTKTYAKTSAELEVREWSGKRAYCLLKSASDFRGGVVVLVDRPIWDMLEVPRLEHENQARSMLKGSFLNGDF